MDKLQLDQHISQQYNADLEKLRTQLLEMGGVVEDQVADAVNAIENADGGLAEKVLKTEDEVDRREVELDEACTLILARRQPAASDLRLVLMVAKATRDLERMGDEANKIAKMAIALNDEGESPRGYVELRHLASNVLKLVNTSLDAFARFDVYAAMKVVRDDKDIDREYKSSMRELITYMMEDPRSISRVMNVMWALRALERIGDHARNIAEHVIYLVHGMDVRHISPAEIEKQLEAKL
ncbi:phosphate signaling complex protein PhoU [Saccharophagus degradans]|uniref:Phosphate-specific transport system accessory protein PhoU n=2 Tax=Saccharophagus degradans TaxID=86304 RepID=Q21E73_SACD2|nr:phosphate signaling complex protein PhoU [Saccharophagus degradans]ABD83006.1 phosphate uptake regulator, PhoU [Saccharophagus degradans 2-40]MBU2984933.1 phosphate signaling complex protein PhoU [Saccharophagus degradans]MDO6423852.1 phosphate signaling complex protein PhoU [Saccharophagus degradans]MDO6607932.1 phosphate signaling complex protein PhoU [Saccharophagus degradans]WGO98811.1 phosphate signaling complex protein PhoU [Saccharophagus degradans]